MSGSLWPWIVLAAAGALHGLNPLTGWAVAAWPAARGATVHRWRVLLPIAAGQLGAVLVVAAGVPAALQFGVAFKSWVAQAIAGVVLLVMLVRHFRGAHRARADAALGLWSFVVGVGHGAGWMLVPALASLCASEAPGSEIAASGSLLLAAVGVAVHLVAMLATTALMAAGTRRVVGGLG